MFFPVRIKVNLPQSPRVTSDEMKTIRNKILGITVANETVYVKKTRQSNEG